MTLFGNDVELACEDRPHPDLEAMFTSMANDGIQAVLALEVPLVIAQRKVTGDAVDGVGELTVSNYRVWIN